MLTTNLAYTENTAAIYDVIDNLESEEYADEITLAGATQQVADLKAANEDFDKTYSSRTAEHYARINSATEISSTHTGMEAAYADVADILNAIYIQSLVLTPEEEALAEVMAIANEINAPITQFAQILARRGMWVK